MAEDNKTNFGTFMLRGDAAFWWESVESLEGSGIITWARFKELFLKKYFPRSMATQMEKKFLELKQGTLRKFYNNLWNY